MMNITKTNILNENYRKDIVSTISSIAKINRNRFDDQTLIREELGIDSLMTIEIIAKIESYYNIQIKEEDIIDINKVGDFINLIEKIITNK
jgi:acyl carrier protein